MADEELMKALKDLPNRVQTASIKQRKILIQDVISVLSSDGITENIVRGICKALLLILPRYRDLKSRIFVRDLILTLLKYHFEWTSQHLTVVLNECAEQLKNLAPTNSTAKTGLTALNWSCLLVKSAANDNEQLAKVIQQISVTQAILLTSVVAIKNEKLSNKAFTLLTNIWKSNNNCEQLYLKTLQNAEPLPDIVVLGATLAKIVPNKKNSSIDKCKEKFLDIFIKTLVSSKTKPSPAIIEACYPFLKFINHDDFKNTLMPALQKAMLRSPEVILEGVGLVLSGVSLDLSNYAVEIGKNLSSNLHSKNDLVREEAADGCRRLAIRCNKTEAIESLLAQVFGIFNGSDGKLTVIDHKLSVLKGAGNLSENNVSNSANLAEIASSHFFKVLETEVNETVLCFALKQLSRWCQKFVKEIPKSVIVNLKKGMDLKTSTPNVRVAYIECMLTCFNKSTTIQGMELIPALLKSIERATMQPTQTGPVTEGLCAARLLLRIAKAEKDTMTKMQILWNVIYDMEKQLFINDKFLSIASENALCHVTQLCEHLLLDHSAKLTGKETPIYRAIIHSVSITSHNVRKMQLISIKQLISVPKSVGVNHACTLLNELSNYMLSVKISSRSERETSEVTKSTEIHPHVFIDVITTICSKNNMAVKDAYNIAFAALLSTHNPAIVDVAPGLWKRVVKFMKVDAKKFINLYSKQICKTYIDEYIATPMNENVLATLISIVPEVLLSHLMQIVENRLKYPPLLQITKDDYFIFLTPDGELYDKSVIPGNEEDTLNVMNIKRESKAYSYKEQIEELALKRELLEKKKKEGKITEPQYTSKQLEVIKAQREKEAAIRNKLRELNTVLINTVSLIQASVKGHSLELSLHFRDLIPTILGTLQSPLAAPTLSNLFIDLHKIVFPYHLRTLGNLIAHVTLRLIRPACDLENAWCEELLPNAVIRTITQIHDQTIKAKNTEISAEIPQSHFTAPMLSYTFPLLKISLLSPEIRTNDQVLHDGLQIISDHVKLRSHVTGENNNNNYSLYHPKLLPHKQMFELLIELISSCSGRIQSQAVACLLDVARSSGGTENCAKASSIELGVLLTALQNPSSAVRDAALRALQLMTSIIPSPKENKELSMSIIRRVWIAKYDVDEDIRELATVLWDDAKLEVTNNLCELLIQDLQHPVECVQQAAACALKALLEQEIQSNPKKIETIIQRLLNIYKEKLTIIPPTLDNFGRVVEKPIDMWGPRRGVALALKQLAPLIPLELIGKLITFFVKSGLGDRHQNVQAEMLAAALEIVELHGKDTINTVLPVFEQFMDKTPKSGSFDAVRQSVVILMGSLAKHLEKDDERLKPIVMRLIAALSTPSQQVQEAVANCLPPLVPAVRDDAPNIVNKLLHQLLKSEKYGDRKGAAYGIAGLVKGMGILALKQLDIMTKLTEAIQDKKNYKHREGALFAFEMLCSMLGRLFEPYIVHVLPHLLLCFGDSSQYVRTATDDTARVVMSKLSAHGVKLVLPSLLAALEDDSWRTKTGSVELLGSMAYCAPKQLSSCLPSIVPKLIEVLSDSHMKVQEAGAEALKVIGSVIRNPEIQAIVPILLQALQDPSNKTSACLQTLLDTQFVHFIDAPSLALIMPVVQRAFQDRSTETRKMAAQIIGNMYSLTDQKDLKPYLPTIIPGLKTSLLDPVPEVRSVSARALGAMVRGMGEASFEDLLPWLMHTLTSETSSVDRSGAAQGLSEVVAGLGVEKLHKLMPEIISTAERTDIAPHVKDGYIMMFIYLPVAFTAEFTPYIGQIINPILQALADENEYVRDTALKAGQRIVNLYAESAIMLLLPELERGLFDDNWRIRFSSVQLLGDLLYRISGVSGKMSTETASEDDNFGTEQSHYAIIKTLGAERRNRVLAGLYMGRSDVALMVRQAALHVWKVVVTNTPRTLREILPTLFTLLLGCLASTSYDKRQVAARTLGDLVRKLGERVLPEIIPILENGLQSDQADTRQGVCIGLSEIMASTSRDMVLTFVNSLVPTVRKALCDPLPEVRQAAAKTFDSLHSTVGVKALDDILPAMLSQLNDEDPEIVECTLDGLRQVMAIKSRVVLPYLVPQLSASPVNTKALAILASVAGEALTRFLSKILPALLTALSEAHGTPDETQQLEYCQTVVLSVTDEAGTRTIIDQLLEHTRASCPLQRRSAAALLCAFCGSSKADLSTHIPQLLRGLIHLCTDEDKEVLQMAWEALNAVTKTIDAKQQALYVADVRQAVRFAISDMKNSDLIPGFCLPKGITPILPIFREAILNGDGDEKESAAQGLGEIIRVTSATALQPSVVTITGPLIRILGDRFSWQVKAAVLETLAILLAKVGVMLKQFLPQLQTTFLKALHDPTRQVRLRAAHALGQLIVIHARCDPLFSDLHSGIRNADDPAVRETMLQALRGVITAAGDKMSEALRKQIHNTLAGMLGHPEDITRSAAAGCFGALTRVLSPEQLSDTLNNFILVEDPSEEWQLRHGRTAALSVALKEGANVVYIAEFELSITRCLLTRLSADKVLIAGSAVRASGYLLQYLMLNEKPLPHNLLVPFVRTMNHSSNDVKQLLARVAIHLAKTVPPEKMASELLKLLLPTLVNGTKEKNGYVKANSEIALITVLRLRHGEDIHQRCMNLLDVGARESLADVVSKVLRKVMSQPEGKEEELDDTLIA